MVTDRRSIRGCESVLGMPLCIPSAVVDYWELWEDIISGMERRNALWLASWWN